MERNYGDAAPGGDRAGSDRAAAILKEALPLVRYRTWDITRLHYDPCAGGRTMVRMEKVSGRTDDMPIVQGIHVSPSQIESILMEVEGTDPHYQLVDRSGPLDELEVWVEVAEALFFDEIRRLKALENAIRDKVERVVGLEVRVRLVEPKTIERSAGKAVRVIERGER